MKTIKFKVALTCWDKEMVWRIIEIQEEKTLHQLHLSIQKAFGWYNDHLYSFFMSNNRYDKKSEYTSPVDIEDTEGVTPATKVKLKDLNLTLGKKFIYIYDFGDNLDHEIEIVGFGQTDKLHRYPQVIGSFGASPEQYAIRSDLDKNEYENENN